MAARVRLKERQPSDEINQETGEAYSDIPGVQHDPVSGVIMDLPASAASAAGSAAGAGSGYISSMAAKGAGEAAGEGAAEDSGAGIFSKLMGKIMPTAKKAGTNLATQEAKQTSLPTPPAKGPSTAEINDSIRTANPTVAGQAGKNLDRLGKEGPGFVNELENSRLDQTAANGRSATGAKFMDQTVKTKSNPSDGNTLNYGSSDINGITKKPDSGRVLDYSSGQARVRLRRPGEQD